jgi:endonuclease YncB( thermonuclease family)
MRLARLPLECALALLVLGSFSSEAAEIVAVTRVVDGNTFEANGDRSGFLVRLAGVNLPDLGAPRMSAAAAASATAFLRCLINRKAVEITRLSESSGPPRVIYAHVWLGELFVNETVLQNGYGQASPDYGGARGDDLLRAYREAVEHRRGVWAVDGPLLRPPCDSTPPSGAAVDSSAGPGLSVADMSETATDRARMRAVRMRHRFDTNRWTVLMATDDGMFGYDANLTVREGPSRYATWLRLDYVEAQPLGDDEYHYTLDRVRIDCKAQATLTVSTVKYNHQADGTTRVVFSLTPVPAEQKWEPIVPESFGEQLYGQLCKALDDRFATKKK